MKPDIIARGCPGFSGADLANLANEAALRAAEGKIVASERELSESEKKLSALAGEIQHAFATVAALESQTTNKTALRI